MPVFDTLLAPFIFIIEQLFLQSLKLSGNHGLAIVLLSFWISLILLPIFILIERAKKKDDAVKLKMKPLVDEIKRCYKGQERYYYLKTLNRQHNYSPLRSLIPILSLLLQIPFFIAAYQFLEGFEPLSGESFLFIKDLSAPDGLLGSINILPILMTVVNLVTAFFYTRNGDTGERRQMLIVAGVFLVLLFKLPSGLVLYWTMNNVFSFFRLFITNPEVFKRGISDKEKEGILHDLKLKYSSYKSLVIKLFGINSLIVFGSQLYWALTNYFDDFILRLIATPFVGITLTIIVIFIIEGYKWGSPLIKHIRIKPVWFFGLLFLSLYLLLSSAFYYKEEHEGLLKLAFVFTMIIESLGILYFFRMRNSTNRILYYLSSNTILLLLFVQFSNFISYLTAGKFSFNIFNFQFLIEQVSWANFIASGIVIAFICLPFYLIQIKYKLELTLKKQYVILILSVFYITGLVFFWNPMIVYASYPDNFNFPANAFLKNNFIPFIILFWGAILFYLIMPKKVKPFLLVFYVSLAILVFLYSSIIPFNVGTLQVSAFSEENKLMVKWYYYLTEAVLIFGVFYAVIYLIKKKHNSFLAIGLSLILFFLIGQSLYRAIDTGSFFQKKLTGSLDEDNQIKEISFSTDKENILLFVIDGAQAWYMHDIVLEDPELKNIYQGFTYYPNTLAMGNYTYASMPSMMNGYDYSIENLNKMEDKPIYQKTSESTELFYNRIKDKGYFFTSTILRYSSIDHSKFDNYIPAWDEGWTKRLALGKPNEMWYTRLWENALFTSSPLFLKPKVYNNRKWVVKDNPNINSSDLQKYNFVRVLPKISNIDSNEKNFIFIHSLFTHNPWDYITDDNQLIREVSPYKNQKWFTYTFAEWLNWMKENNVYDNTKIILVADHGPDWWHYQKETDPGNAPIVYSDNDNLTINRFLHLNPLLLVKDFNQSEPLIEDWRIMSNSDVHSIAFGIDDPTKGEPLDRTFTTHYTRWHTDLRTRIKYENKAKFRVSGNVYDMNNWIEVTE